MSQQQIKQKFSGQKTVKFIPMIHKNTNTLHDYNHQTHAM